MVCLSPSPLVTAGRCAAGGAARVVCVWAAARLAARLARGPHGRSERAARARDERTRTGSYSTGMRPNRAHGCIGPS
eukprot:4366825-Prymnesium_polylepis.1